VIDGRGWLFRRRPGCMLAAGADQHLPILLASAPVIASRRAGQRLRARWAPQSDEVAAQRDSAAGHISNSARYPRSSASTTFYYWAIQNVQFFRSAISRTAGGHVLQAIRFFAESPPVLSRVTKLAAQRNLGSFASRSVCWWDQRRLPDPENRITHCATRRIRIQYLATFSKPIRTGLALPLARHPGQAV